MDDYCVRHVHHLSITDFNYLFYLGILFVLLGTYGTNSRNANVGIFPSWFVETLFRTFLFAF